MDASKEFQVELGTNTKAVSKRVVFITSETTAQVKRRTEPRGMAFPHLVVRTIIAFEIMAIVLGLIALFVDAPLEEIANPDHTPNPAKAPWYFLGLQELLHYFPPVIAGVLIPVLVVIALIIIPYFDVNIRSRFPLLSLLFQPNFRFRREGLWKGDRRRRFVILLMTVAFLSAFILIYRAYAVLVPTLVTVGLMLIPYFSKRRIGWIGWLAEQPLASWIMTWFVIVATTLTLIGILFRGPEWRWVWPWKEGLY